MSETPVTPPTGWTRSRAALVCATLVVLLPFIVVPLIGLDVENDVETWLPQGDPYARALDWFHDHFGDETRMLVSWDGSSLNDPRVEQFAEMLAGPRNEEGERPGRLAGIGEVRTPRDVVFRMLENKIDRDDAVQRLVGLLVGPGPLKVQLTDAGRAQISQVRQRLQESLSTEPGVEVKVAEEVPSGIAAGAGEESQRQFEEDEFAGAQADDPYELRPYDLRILWPGQNPHSALAERVREVCLGLEDAGTALVEACFFDPFEPVAVSIRLTPEGDERVGETLQLIRQSAYDVGVSEDALHMGGTPVGRSELNREAVASIWNQRYPLLNFYKRSPVILSVLVSIVFAFLVLHSLRLAVLVLVTSLYAALIATALVPLTGTALNMVLVVMPNLLFVLTTSGAIHVANYWQHAALEDNAAPISRAVRMALQPCTLASVTTAIGLASLATSLLLPVRQFGVFSAVGCLLSLVMVLVVFPALMVIWSGKPLAPHQVDRSRWESLGRWLSCHSMSVSLFCLLLFVVAGWGLRYFETQTKVIRYFRPSLRIVHDYEFLEGQLSGILPLEVVVAFPQALVEESDSVQRLEIVRDVGQRILENPEISGVLSLADFRPRLLPPAPNAPLTLKARYNRTVRGLDDYLANGAAESQENLVATAREDITFPRADGNVAINSGDELWRIRAQTAVLSDANYSSMRDDVDRAVGETLAPWKGSQHLVTGTVPLFLRTQEAVLESLIRSFGLAFIIIAIVMMVLLRSVAGGLITMVPNLLPVVVVFGLISWAGIKVDIGTMITASVALGIAVDGTLHLITWFRDGLRRRMSRTEAISLGLSHCGPAMWQTSAIIGVGMLIVSGSDLLLISRFGWLMAAIISAALLADIILLPALLAGPLGAVIERRCAPEVLTGGPQIAVDRGDTEASIQPTTEAALRR